MKHFKKSLFTNNVAIIRKVGLSGIPKLHKYPSGAMRHPMDILALYPGRSANNANNMVPPCECPMYDTLLREVTSNT